MHSEVTKEREFLESALDAASNYVAAYGRLVRSPSTKQFQLTNHYQSYISLGDVGMTAANKAVHFARGKNTGEPASASNAPEAPSTSSMAEISDHAGVSIILFGKKEEGHMFRKTILAIAAAATLSAFAATSASAGYYGYGYGYGYKSYGYGYSHYKPHYGYGYGYGY